MRVPVYLHEIIFAMKRAKAQLKRQGKTITVEVCFFTSHRLTYELKTVSGTT